jgi:hypothetical protein
MSQEKPTPKPSDDQPETVIDNTQGDVVTETSDAPVTHQTSDKEDNDNDGPPPKFVDDARNAIFKNADAHRRSVGEYRPATESKPAFQGHEEPMVVRPTEEEEPSSEDTSQQSTEQDELDEQALDKYVTVTVYGQPVRMTVREAMADARLHRAGGVKLDEVKELHGRLRRLEEELQSQAASPKAEPAEADEAQRRAAQREQLKAIASKLGVMDDDDGLDALETVIATARTGQSAPSLTVEQVQAIFQDSLREDRTLTEIGRYAGEVGPQDFADKHLRQVMVVTARDERLKDLAQVLPEEQLSQLEQMASQRPPTFLGQVYQEAQRRYPGAKWRDTAALFKAAHAEARKVFGRPGQASIIPPSTGTGTTPAPLAQRQELKRSTVQAPARRQTPVAPPAQAQTLEANRSAAVERMRKARGQAV